MSNNFKFSVNDAVKIIESGNTYPRYSDWAERYDLKNFKMYKSLSNNDICKIIVAEKHLTDPGSNLYGVLHEGNHYIVGEKSIEKIVVSQEDTGEDLVGREFHRGGTSLYTFNYVTFDQKSNKLNFSSKNGCHPACADVDYCRKKLKNGDWTLKEIEKPRQNMKLEAERVNNHYIAEGFYKFLLSRNWSVQAIAKLSDDVAERYLSDNNFKCTKPHQLRQLVQNILAKKQRSLIPSDAVFNGTITHQKIEDNLNIIDDRFKDPKIIISNQELEKAILQHKTYTSITKPYTTNKEENTMKPENEITITVPTTPYAETTVITMYGQEIKDDSEETLFQLLSQIESDQLELKRVNKTAKSSRVTAKIAALGSARNKVVAMIDALPAE
jgi:hypothetical protein